MIENEGSMGQEYDLDIFDSLDNSQAYFEDKQEIDQIEKEVYQEVVISLI